MGKLYLYIGFFIFGLAMLLVFPWIALAHFLLPGRKADGVKLFALKFWAASFFTFGIRFRLIKNGFSQKDWPKSPVILIANHNSLLDTPALFLMLKRFAFPLAKIELTRPPVFGQLCSWLTLPVDRNSQESRAKSYEDMKGAIRQGQSLLIFPEGRTNKSTNRFQNFESGAFRLAFDMHVPIAPALIHHSRHCLAATHPMRLRPGVVQTELGPLFYPSEFDSPKALQDALEQWYAQSSYQIPASVSFSGPLSET